MRKGERFAFYGILVDDEALALVGEYGRFCHIPGRMWDAGHFPAMTKTMPGSPSVVVGRLWSPPEGKLDREQVVAALDALEGYTGDPHTSMYVREWTRLIGGEMAWVYVWNGGTATLTEVEHGDWLRHLSERRARRAYPLGLPDQR